jgi:hypothetical protein
MHDMTLQSMRDGHIKWWNEAIGQTIVFMCGIGQPIVVGCRLRHKETKAEFETISQQVNLS